MEIVIILSFAAYVLVDVFHSRPIYNRQLNEAHLAFWSSLLDLLQVECQKRDERIVVTSYTFGANEQRTKHIRHCVVAIRPVNGGQSDLLYLYLTPQGVENQHMKFEYKNMMDGPGRGTSYQAFKDQIMATIDSGLAEFKEREDQETSAVNHA